MIDDAAARARTHIRHALLLASAMVVGSLLLTIAHKPLGLIDAETTTRGVMVLIGLMLIVVGNRLPKQNEGPPPQSVGEITTRQAIGRVGGWAMLLGGLTWTVLWVLAPRDLAQVGSVAAVIAAVVVMLGYTVWRYRAHRRSSAP